MKASFTLREHPKNPFLKAKIPISIFGIPFCSGIEAGDYNELCISFTTAFSSGPLLRFCYRPNDSCRPFGLILRTGVGQFGSPSGSPISMSVEFGLIGNSSRPSFLLHFKPRSGDFSVRRSVENPIIHFSSAKYEPSKCALSEEKMSWNQLFSCAYGELSDGEMRATMAVPVKQAVVKLGWSMRFPPLVAADDGGLAAENLLKQLPYLVLRETAVEHVTGKGEKRGLRDKGGDVVKACVVKSDGHLSKNNIKE